MSSGSAKKNTDSVNVASVKKEIAEHRSESVYKKRKYDQYDDDEKIKDGLNKDIQDQRNLIESLEKKFKCTNQKIKNCSENIEFLENKLQLLQLIKVIFILFII